MSDSLESPNSETTLPALWRLPHAQNPDFAGRDRFLHSLHEQFSKASHAGHTIVLTGPAGIGKTQIAIEYAYRYRDHYPLVCWLRAMSPEQLEHDLYTLAQDLNGRGFDGGRRAAESIIRKHLAARSGWLLIFDSANDSKVLAGCVPPRHRGRVLITTRQSQWHGPGHLALVPALERGDAMFFLKQRSGREGESILSSGQLAKALGDFPLALELASKVIAEAKISFNEYLQRFESLWAEMLLDRRNSSQNGLALSLELAVRQLSSMAPAAAELLDLLVFFGPEGFQRSWLTTGERVLVEPLATTVREFVFLQEALQWMEKFSLIELKAGEINLSQTVGHYVRNRLNHEQFTEHAHLALRLMESAFRFDSNDPRTWSEAIAMLPHATATLEHAQKTDVTVAAAVRLMNQIGQCLFRNGQYEKARTTLDQAIAVGYRLYGEANPRLSPIANNLGRVLLRLGEIQSAQAQFQWALALDELTYGANHPHVAEILNNYGLCLLRSGDMAQAAMQFERALNIYEMSVGTSHPSTANILNNIGYIQLKAGDLHGAWQLLERALGAVSAAYGSNHPDVASVLLNRGDVLRLQGNRGAAMEHYQKAIQIDESCYGPAHPDVARDAAHIAELLLVTNDLAGARRFFERALAIDESVFGATHPILIPRLEDLGRCLRQTGQPDVARGYLEKAAEIRRALLPPPVADSNDSSTAAA